MLPLYIAIQVIGLLVILAVTIILYRQISVKNQSLILLYTVFMGLNAFGYLIELGSTSLDAALNGVKFAYVGKVYSVYCMIMVMARLTGVRLPGWLKTSVFAFATFVLSAVISCKHHNFYYSTIDYIYEGSFPHLVLGHGVLYYAYVAYIFGCFAGVLGMCIYGHHRAIGIMHRKQIQYFMIATIFQVAGYAIFLTGITDGYDTTALFNVVFVFMLLRVTLKYNLVGTLDAAKDKALDDINTGVVIVDDNKHLLYANSIAKKVYSGLEGVNAAQEIDALVEHANSHEYTFSDNKVFTATKQDVYDAEMDHGQMFVLNDVTVSYYYAQALADEVDDKTSEIRKMQEEMEQFSFQVVNALSSAVEAKDRYTNGHSLRVASYAREIARRMGMNAEEQREIYYAGLLHDIGKIRVPDTIINKQGKLTDDEFQSMKLHTVAGYYILKNVSEIYDVTSGAKWHHERYDGGGYPDGLAGEDIPLISRIICVADSYDAMTSNRSYREALTQELVKEEFLKGLGTQFDPRVASVMLQMIDEDKDYKLRQIVSEQKNILLVDDNAANYAEVETVLAGQPSYMVHCAPTMMECTRMMSEKSIHLVLVDMDAETLDGFDIIQVVQSYGNVPIIFLTGSKEMDIIKKANDLGVMDFLTKPYLPQNLVETVHNILQQKADF